MQEEAVKPEASDVSLQASSDEWTELRKASQASPYNEAVWDRLLDRAEESGDLEKIKEAYEALLEKYPNTSSAQISYLNHFLVNQATFPFAESLFARFLRTSVSVDLWKFYIIYVRRLNAGPATRDTVAKAYDFALQHVGQDKDSSSIWEEYIQFVKSGETKSTWEEQQKMDNLRKIYQRAVQIPLENVEMLWKDYEAFESSLNKITAKKFLQDLSPAHMTARSKLRELRKFLGPLLPPAAPANGRRTPLNLPRKPTFSDEEKMTFAGAWKRYLKWEESNPLEIEDKNVLNARVHAVYRKALERMRFFSEIWFMAYTWLSGVGRTDEAITTVKTGIEANPTSYVINFTLAEHYERSKNFPEVHAIFTKLLQGMQEELEAAEKSLGSGANGNTTENVPEDANENKENPNGIQKEASTMTAHSQTSTSTASTDMSDQLPMMEFRERKQEYGVVYIMYIRFAMRSEGLDASRAVFSKARKDKWASWEVYEAAALMEYHVAKQLGVANRILNRALDRFKTEIEYVLRYLTFLMTVNDENNARALFEQTVGTFPPNKARPLWERWARYEYQFGDLEAALKLEKRMAEVYPEDPPIKRFAQRHSYSTIDAIAFRDLGSPPSRKRAQQQASMGSSLFRSDTLPAMTVGVPPPPLTGHSAVYKEASLSSAPVSNAATAGSSTTPVGAYRRGASAERDRDARRRGGVDDAKLIGKRAREHSPPPHLAGRERERYGAAGTGGRRYGSPAGWADRDRFDRDRERSRSPVRGGRGAGLPDREREKEREEPSKPLVPPVISWFIGQLPPPAMFDGPVFRTEDLMNLFRNVVIPASNPVRPRSPPANRPMRPPPDYGPYRGPGAGRGRY